jgi:hypothetical protein
MVGVYETLFSTLSADGSLQTLLAATATDKKVYPITHVGRSNLPSVRVAVINGKSDIGLAVDRTTVDLLVSSKVSTTELNAISARIDVLLNRKRLATGSTVMHLLHKVYEADGFDDQSLEYRRVMRYHIIKT